MDGLFDKESNLIEPHMDFNIHSTHLAAVPSVLPPGLADNSASSSFDPGRARLQPSQTVCIKAARREPRPTRVGSRTESYCAAFVTVLTLFLSEHSSLADALAQGYSKDKVEPAVKMEVSAFPLEEVRLLDGPFHHAMEMDGKYLLSLDTDRLVRNFRINAGLPTHAEPLGGWEAPDCELRGHFVGHYMSACAQMYAATGDARYKEKGEAVVRALGECQEKVGNG